MDYRRFCWYICHKCFFGVTTAMVLAPIGLQSLGAATQASSLGAVAVSSSFALQM